MTSTRINILHRLLPMRAVQFFLFVALVASIPGCSGSSYGRCGKGLPATRPPGFSLTYGVSGGMLPRASTLTVAEKSCSYSSYFNGTTKTISFQMSRTELDELYKALIDNKFDQIETFEEEVYDRGGNTIAVSWRGGDCSISNSGLTFIATQWADQWNRILDRVERIRAREVASHSVTTTFVADPSIYGLSITLALDEETLAQDSLVQKPNGPGEVTFTATSLPGESILGTSFETGSWSQTPVVIKGGERIRLVRQGDEIHGVVTP